MGLVPGPWGRYRKGREQACRRGEGVMCKRLGIAMSGNMVWKWYVVDKMLTGGRDCTVACMYPNDPLKVFLVLSIVHCAVWKKILR